MKKLIAKWLEDLFGTYYKWDDFEFVPEPIRFKTRYGLSYHQQGDVYYDVSKQKMFVNVSSDPHNPLWSEIV